MKIENYVNNLPKPMLTGVEGMRRGKGSGEDGTRAKNWLVFDVEIQIMMGKFKCLTRYGRFEILNGDYY